MASDLNNLIKKRSNPFSEGKFSSIANIQKEVEKEEAPVKKTTKSSTAKTTSKPAAKKVEKPVEVKKIVEEEKPVVEVKPQVEEVVQTVINQPEKPAATVTKVVVASKKVESRDKYTATMETELRTRVKIASAKMRIQFSQFIELAVTEKLEREGF